ncbi:MAG: M1 family metallopeptidase [Candidatus Saccharimonadales bacterium]
MNSTTVQRLLPQFAPGHYDLTINLTKREKRQFSGEVTITGTLQKAGKQITLHAHELTVESVQIDGHDATFKIGQDDELILTTARELASGEHEIHLAFSGTITDPMHGLYPCYFKLDGKEKELLATQFESHHAREVFPCIDEPSAKATFDLTLITEKDVTTLANTPVAQQKEDGNQLTTTFDRTPKMSTYLLAFVVGELGYTETTNEHGVKIRVYATPDKIEQTRFSLDLAAKALDFYDDYFDNPYPLKKCDMVALPDFSSGAMENWGLITYRESCLLVDPENTATDTKQFIATVVCHELAHQWFGNLVTMAWWDDLWLNESFANWMEHHAVNHFFPEWQMWEQFSSTEKQMALTRDGLASVQSVQQHVSHPEEIRSLFDSAIVYAKGSCLIRMLHEYLGDITFRDGLRVYMQRHKYGNTETTDLWNTLSEASGKDVASFMQPWVHQSGHPVVTVGASDSTAVLHQRRFYASPTEAKPHDPTAWPVPLLSESIGQDVMSELTVTVPVAHTDAPFMLNKGYTGFYHTRYDTEQLAHLAKAVSQAQVAATDRQGLLIDNLALTRAGLLKTTELFNLLAHYHNEPSYAVWLSMTSVIGALKVLVNEDPVLKPHLQKYVERLAKEEFHRLGWDKKPGESYFDELLRPNIIGLMAYAETPEVVSHSLKLFDEAKSPQEIPADLRGIVYTVAVRERGQSAFGRQLAWYKETASAEERINLCAGLTSMRDENLANQATELLTTRTVKLQDLGYWFAYLMRNSHARKATWEWMHANWSWIQKNFSADMHYTDFPRYSAAAFSTREQLAEYKKFFEPKQKEPALARTITQGIEDIEVRMLWRERDITGIADYLQKTDR